MARNDPQMNLRVPMNLKEKIEKSAFDNNRTITAEAISRLEKSFEEHENYELLYHFMMETYKDQQQKIDELHEMVKSLTNEKSK